MTIASLLLALIVTSAADTSNGEPVLLDFHASWCGPCQTMRAPVARLAAKNYPIQSIDIDRSKELAERYKVDKVPTFIVADGQGRVLARTMGVLSAPELAAFYNEAAGKLEVAATTAPKGVAQATTSQSSRDSVDDEGEESASASRVANPKPWETVVRIKMHLSKSEWGFGSGTIISSNADESIILTCAHIFKGSRGEMVAPRNFRTKIAVDLFDGKNINYKHPQLTCIEKDIVGEAIDYDFNNDVGLIRIRPGRVLPASRVVPAEWKPKRGMPMYSVGCSHGEDATAWDTRILDPRVAMKSGEQSFFEMKCESQPKEGRSGGGLYTQDGYVAGVCDFADPNEHVGLYAVPTAIHKLLDRNRMTAYYKAPVDGPNRLLAATNRNQTRVRAQSADLVEAAASGASDTAYPDPNHFGIRATPASASTAPKVAVNQPKPAPWQTADLDDAARVSRPSRRPERNVGESIDPGPRPRVAVPTDLAMEPNSDSALYEPTEPASGAAPAVAPAASEVPTPRRTAPDGWKGVRTSRPAPRPSN